MDSFVPLVGAAVGSALTIVGGFVSQTMLHQRQREAENRSRTANKLEEAGRLANKIKEAGMAVRNMGFNILINKLREGEELPQLAMEKPPTDELILLIKLYEPSLLQSAEALVGTETELSQYVFDKLADFMKTALEGQARVETLGDLHAGAYKISEAMEAAYSAFMDSLSDKFVEYRL